MCISRPLPPHPGCPQVAGSQGLLLENSYEDFTLPGWTRLSESLPWSSAPHPTPWVQIPN